MVFKYGINFLIIVLFSINTYAQTTFSIQGTVLDQQKKSPIELTTISLILKDKIFQKVTSDKEGKFSLKEIEKGSYVLKFQSPGYTDLIIPIHKLSSNLMLNEILLEEKIETLDAVVIEGTSDKLIEKKMGKIIIRVDSDIMNEGASITDIMENIPSVDIDENGTILMRGSTDVRIYIDGKPAQISLDQMSPVNISKIELITSPSAKWDADGSSIINVILKKNRERGLNINGNFSYTQGIFAKYRSSLSANYTIDKFSFNSTLSYNKSKNFFGGRTEDFLNDILQITENINRSDDRAFTFGVDYFLDDKNQFFVNYKRNFSSPEAISSFVVNDIDRNFHETDYKYNNHDLSVGYKKILDGENHFLDIEAYFSWSPSDSESERISEDNLGNNTLLYDYNGSGNFAQFNVDYQKEISSKHSFDLGVQSSFQDIDQFLQNTSINNPTFPDFALDYNFSRNILAGYFNYNGTFNKWSLRAGLRTEYVKRELALNTDNFDYDYTQVYPNVLVSNTINDANSISLSYNRRLVRPQHWQLTTIPKYFSPTSFAVRNPELQPSYINVLELSHYYQKKGFSLSTTVYYTNMNDRISHIQRPSDANSDIYIFTLENIESDNAYGLEVSSRWKINNWYTTTNTLDVNTAVIRTIIDDQIVERDFTSYYLRSYNRFKWNKNNFQLNFRHKGNAVFPQGKRNPYGKVDFGYNRKIFSGNGSIAIQVYDIFNTYNPEYEIRTDNAYRLGLFEPESRRLRVTFSYNFKSNKTKNIRRKKRNSIERRDVNGVQF
ncbi:TonB-dependent receptor [Kordia sp. YSTF-M3]|uniref:TonB-dependent receptor n=1 Tax=Kordia aestuariivivens TaxID=2759037 RepID=A0ABR7Q6E8_9FLAO|nr:outer membrane beta-barrel family protein [Kordia aestuariivivens]MBC8754087.1 TonB-dependent receptor [Kordia aestuariivivens]